MGNGNISIEFAEANGNKVYIVVFRNQIGKTLYQGTISVKHSKKRRIEEKTYKQQLKVALMSKDPTTNQFKANHCVISFQRSDDLNQFERDFDDAIAQLKSQDPTIGDSP